MNQPCQDEATGGEVTAVTEIAEYALTRRQTLFWLDEQLYPEAPYHHVVLRVDLSGALEEARFREAYQTALANFDQFRLSFELRGGEPRQRFRGELKSDLPCIELAAKELERWIRRRACRRFDFSRALFDAALLRLSPAQHIFYFCQHHIISDGTSVGLFLQDLERAYRGEPVPERPSYAAYLRHEQSYRDSPRAERDAAHFRRRLPADMPPLALYGRTRVERSFGIDRSRLPLSEEESAAFARVVADERIELIDAAMSRWVALATLLFAYVARVSGVRRTTLATPVPNRSAEFQATGGLLMEQTFLSVEVEPDDSFATLADKVRKELFAALRHGRHCASDRGLAYASLNLLRLPSLSLPGLETQVSLAPLATLIDEDAGGQGDLRDTFGVSVLGFDERAPLTLSFDFHRKTFPPALRERAKGHFRALFGAMLCDLETKVFAVELVSREEKTALLARGRGRQLAEPAPDLLARLAAHARQRPAEIALRAAGKSWSYAALAAEVGRLGARLAHLGVGPGVRVAFCLTRGPDEPLAMLATLAAGGAYVPLDRHHPPERLRLILEDAAPQVLITERALVPQLQPPIGTALLMLDAERAALAQCTPLALEGPRDSAQCAYVLFTSGSTGRPKGVEVPRRALSNFLRAMAHRPGLAPGDRLLAVTTTTFDIAGLELFLPLYVGASVQIAERDTVLDPLLLRETLEREPISVFQATPTTYRLLLEAGFRKAPRPLKLLCGGEAISRELAERLLAAGAELWNMYGPTETTVWSSVAKLTPGAEPISIGGAIDATQLYVLGPHRTLEPDGVVGELCIGGEGLALGYLGRPELTRERFVDNPHGPLGDRIYRTGDLARYTPSGQLLCLGRLDHQVKIRGFRIELGEVESCLRPLPGVREVVVSAFDDAGGQSLCAYWVGSAEAEEAMRVAAARALPSYMQPSAYVCVPEFPLNTNGKIDRARLPAPQLASRERPSLVTFADALEERMAGLVRTVLGGREIDPALDFFALGGDSVRAIALRRRIQETFGVELPLSVMFDSPTVAGLVRALTRHGERSAPLFLELRHGQREGPPLICIMGIALYRDLAQALDTDLAVYGAHVPILDAKGKEPGSVEQLAQRYTRLILERVPQGPYHLAGLCFGGLVAFEVAHQLIARGHRVQTLAVFDGLLPGGARYSLAGHARALARAPRRVIVARMQARLQRLRERFGAQEEGFGEPEPELALRSQAAAKLTREYVAHARPLPLDFDLFRATEREEAPWYRISPTLGWDQLGRGLRVHAVQGTHLSILQTGCVQAIAAVLKSRLSAQHSAATR